MFILSIIVPVSHRVWPRTDNGVAFSRRHTATQRETFLKNRVPFFHGSASMLARGPVRFPIIVDLAGRTRRTVQRLLRKTRTEPQSDSASQQTREGKK